MTAETDRAKEVDATVKAADKKRADEAAAAEHYGEKLDVLLSHLDAINKRLDAMESSQPAQSVGDEGGGTTTSPEFPRDPDDPDGQVPLAADGSRKRKDMTMDSKWAADARADAEECAAFKAETGSQYEIRPVTVREHQSYSPQWKNVNLDDLSGAALRVATTQIFADSISASKSPAGADEGFLREVIQRDPNTGHITKSYYGEPRAWLRYFSGGGPRLARFRFNDRDRDS